MNSRPQVARVWRIPAAMLLGLMLLLSGCIVRSYFPFCTSEQKIDPASLGVLGTWTPAKGMDLKISKRHPWLATNDRLLTFDENDRVGPLQWTFFRVNDSLFVDFAPTDIAGDNDDSQQGQVRVGMFWAFHLQPCHSVAKVSIEKGQVRLIPLNFDYFMDRLSEGQLKLPSVGESKSERLILATTAQWQEFLAQNGNDPKFFPANNALVFDIKPATSTPPASASR